MLYNLRKEQNVKELEMLKLKQQEEKLLGKLKNMFSHEVGEHSKIKAQIYEIEDSLNAHHKALENLVNEYFNDFTSFEKNLSEMHFDKLEKLRKEYLDHLRSFEVITFNNFEKEKLYNDPRSRNILEVKYKEMNNLHKQYKIKEIDIIKDYLINKVKSFNEKSDEILEAQKLYEQLFKHYILRRNELGQYQEDINQLKKVEEEFYEAKNSFYETRVKGAVASVIYFFLMFL